MIVSSWMKKLPNFLLDFHIPSSLQIERVKHELYDYIVEQEIIPDSVRLGNVAYFK
jgi:hypothetical protein